MSILGGTRSRWIGLVALNVCLAGALAWTASRVFAAKERRPAVEDPVLGKLPGLPDLPLAALEIVAQEKEVTNPAIRAPWIEFSIKNVADVPVWVVRPLDGSDYGVRTPKCRVMIWDAAGRRADPSLPIRCGTLNSLALGDFVSLKPGEALPLRQFLVHPETALPEGEYTIQCLYETQGPYRLWLGTDRFHTPELLSRIDQVPKGTFLSAPLRVRVRK